MFIYDVYYNNKITIGQFVSFTAIASTVTNIITNILDFFYLYPTALISYNRIKEYTNQNNNTSLIKQEQKDFTFQECLEIKSLAFRYPNQRNNIIDNLSFKCHPCEIVVICGKNGNGKTTLQNLLAKILVKKDCIFIDGKEIHQIKNEQFRQNVSYLYQKNTFFSGTLIQNIKAYRDNIDNEVVDDLIEALNFKKMLSILPNGLNTYIYGNSENFRLSQGNEQKISLIRVFASNPKIVILDEPTTNLDIETCDKFIDFLMKYKMKYNALIIVSTHDEKCIQVADRTILL